MADESSEKRRVIEKIKKCLALSKSCNEHEAQVALRQAQKLIELHGISDIDMLAADVSEADVKAGAGSQPSQWEVNLAVTIGDAFGCRTIFKPAILSTVGHWRFIGCSPGIDIAEYAFDVLYRQCKRARREYIKSKLKRCKPANKTRRADLFSRAWVASVTSKIHTLAGSEEQERAIEAFVSAKYPALSTVEARNRNAGKNLSNRDVSDQHAGFTAGRKAELNRGMEGTERQRLEGIA